MTVESSKLGLVCDGRFPDGTFARDDAIMRDVLWTLTRAVERIADFTGAEVAREVAVVRGNLLAVDVGQRAPTEPDLPAEEG